jgi:16S rRNA (guanine527-N7)-methyltransferase
LQITFPRWQVALLEATTKKIRFLEQAVHDLGLEHTRVVHGRAEDIAHDPEHRERYDLVTARAVTHASALVELTLPFVAVHGCAILYKGASALSDELQAAEAARVILGAAPPTVIPAGPAGGEGLCLVRYEKLSRTPSLLPRRAGIPEHQALRSADGARIRAAQKTRPSR